MHRFFSMVYKQFPTLKSSQYKHQISQMLPPVTKFSILSAPFLKLNFNSPTAPDLLVLMKKMTCRAFSEWYCDFATTL